MKVMRDGAGRTWKVFNDSFDLKCRWAKGRSDAVVSHPTYA
uniref:Uncharacterized protein n=1 Tax=Arundo donax TaxID=35708 RepID=A0A0A9G6X0_ARUDO